MYYSVQGRALWVKSSLIVWLPKELTESELAFIFEALLYAESSKRESTIYFFIFLLYYKGIRLVVSSN